MRTRVALLSALVLVFVVGFGARWYYAATSHVVTPLRGDALQYHAEAWNIVHHGVFSIARAGAADPAPDDYRDPGYPLFLALWMKLMGDGPAWYATVLMVQALIGALSAVLTVLVGVRWLGVVPAAIAGLLVALWPHCITSSDVLLTETLFGFLVILSLWLLIEACRAGRIFPAALAGFISGMAALTNAIFLPMALAVSIILWWRRSTGFRTIAAYALASLLLPAVWSIRNTTLNTSVTASYRAVQNLVQGAWPQYHQAWRQSVLLVEAGPAQQQAASDVLKAIDKEINLFSSDPPAGVHHLADRLKSRPLHFLTWYLLEKPRLLWGWSIRIGQGDMYIYPTADSPFMTNPAWRFWAALCQIINPWLFIAGIGGCAVILLRRRSRHLSECVPEYVTAIPLIVLFVTLVYCVFQSEPRYSIPFRPLEILLATGFVCVVLRKVKQIREAGAKNVAGSAG